MPYGAVTLVPGVNAERTPTLLRAGFAQGSLIRFRDSLAQKYGGWERFYPFQVTGTPRDLHGWQDLNSNTHLAVGTTAQLAVVSDGYFVDITPTDLTSDFAPNVSTVNGSAIVTIEDPNIENVSLYDSVFFAVPISQGGVVLDGLYPINSITGTHSFTVNAGANATSTQANPTATNAGTVAGNATLNFASTPSWVVEGMTIYNLTVPGSIPASTTVLSVTATTVVMSANAAAPGVGSGDNIVFSSVPVFTTAADSGSVNVFLIDHGLTQVGESVFFAVSTTGNGVTVFGHYTAIEITDADNFAIQASTAATAAGSFAMNGGNAEIVYHIALGPLPTGVGYGLGNYGAGAYGFGTSAGTPQTGEPISATDWTLDNWGELLVACPANQGIYVFDPTGGIQNASIIPQAPAFASGIFISTTAQILVAYGASEQAGVGELQQPLLVRWCTPGDFTVWSPASTNQAGNFVIPIGSEIKTGLAVSNQNLIWTDQDLWSMNYIGPPNVYGFNKIGAGMGAVSRHAVQQLRSGVFWMGPTNFYAYTGGGANALTCPVWDAVFQNLNTDFLQNVRALPNTPFNEVGWAFPSAASLSGECDSYVKVNITEPGAPWDYGIGVMPRAAWIDQSVLGMPIGASPQGFLYQHETTNNADGAPLPASFTTGYFYLAEGEDFVVVDQVIPDFKWAEFNGGTSAQIQLTFTVLNFPGDTPRTYGPYTVTSATKFITVRFRGRLMSVTVASADLNSFWRVGSMKYRFNASGRR